MRWINHIVIGASVCAVARPELVPVAIIGSTAPDWLEFVLRKMGYWIRHRTTTHYWSVWVMGVLFAQFLWDFHGVIFWFSVGGVSHVVADSLSITGIPLG